MVAVLVAIGLSLATPGIAPKAPEYQATTNVLMGGSVSLTQNPSLVKSSPVLEVAIGGLAISMSVEELRSKLSASQVDSQTVSIQVTDADPAAAVRLADAVAQSYVSYLNSVGKTRLAAAREELARSLAALETGGSAEAVGIAIAVLSSRATPAIVITRAEVLQEPNVASEPPGNLARNTILAAILGVIIAVVVIFFLESLQRPVRSPAQMERRFGLTNLGSVPRWRKGRGTSGSSLGQPNSEPGLS